MGSPSGSGMLSGDRFTIAYRIRVRDGRTIEAHTADIAVEQTVETPPDCIPPKITDAGITGRIERIEPLPGSPDAYSVRISYRCDIVGASIPQFLNVLFGNISLKANIKIAGLDLPEAFLAAWPGPAFGIDGLRTLTGVAGRPLACAALKPMGLDTMELAGLAYDFAAGGADLIKDDHGLSDQPFHPFRERIPRCQESVARANSRSNKNALYLPMISGRFEELGAQVEFAVRHGVRGVFVAPFLVGPDAVRWLSGRYGLVVMAHPALTGAHFHDPDHGMTPAVLLGTVFRLIGSDVSVFPSWGGRFPFTRGECIELADALRQPLGPLRPAFPCPAGGMTPARVQEMAEAYGRDTVLLIGGALLRERAKVAQNTATFLDAIRAEFP
jgi:ribulose-bisphosphate carboxylase large chain